MASPAAKQVCPNRAACWSPAAPAMGISPPKMEGSVNPNTPLEGQTRGSMERGICSFSKISSSQSRVWILKSMVREALERSVRWQRPLVRL